MSPLSSIGPVVHKVMAILRNPASSATELKEMIEVDPPLCSQVLRRANSAYYGIRRDISSIQEAIVFIGFNAVTELALSLKVGKIFEQEHKVGGYSRKALWKHSLAVALCCKYIYRREFRERGDDIYSTALLHDLGIIAEEQFMPNAFADLIERCVSENASLPKIEEELFGYTHAGVGQRLASHWRLPAEMTAAIMHHEKPPSILPPGAKQSRPALTVCIANYACIRAGFSCCEPPLPPVIEEGKYEEALAQLQIPKRALELIITEVQGELKQLQENGELYL
ncbi:MAG: hypothetical protein A2X49_10695 [Lentisphaerae bacterium GWF2_52_8]|nr:MAG: hypothetical protein A2X49_10695 [Lentisphaerae bacterium GWF2_52_8]